MYILNTILLKESKNHYYENREKNKIGIKFICALLCIVFISGILRIYNLPFGFEQLTSFKIKIIICLVGIVTFIILVIFKKGTILPLIKTAAAFWLYSCLATLLNYKIYKNDDIAVSLVIQSFWFATLVLFYFFTMDFINFGKIIVFVTIYFIISSLIYYKYNPGETPNAINSIYYIILLIPFLMCLKSQICKTCCINFCFFLILLSEKRTAMLCLIFSLFFYYIIEFLLGNKKNRKKLYMVIILLIFSISCLFLYKYVLEKFDLNILLRLNSLQTDKGSGRGMIYNRVWEAQKKSSLFNWIFGNGYNSVELNKITYTSAHNDFLEILYDYGIIALVIYLIFILQLFKQFLLLLKNKSNYTAPFLASIILFGVMSMFSHLIIYPTYFIYLIFFWITCINNENLKLIST